MRIRCTYCGERGHEEFTYLGDATVTRPEAAAEPGDEVGRARWHDYVYLRENPARTHHELWHHVGGCRAWLVVTRATRTHASQRVEPAYNVALARNGHAR